eukprot:Blabericola_migrator_1__4025@NODE_2223_length_3098_cov_214_446057_g1400_i0_p1_GENE_NODE_2223_length_3098_cov_214_446057_g1400_i0NODE_2223_length_3098_cov_214_446057_g1400_i0_p1_ORF_typecomplete_len325_score70_39TraF/PF13728_6/0_018OST3_OST6/PF04756_13/2_9e02OST3_OST6/PF04756_13/0_72_NODE_2223_length_3098_cov_214_446057_g1400_i08971871
MCNVSASLCENQMVSIFMTLPPVITNEIFEAWDNLAIIRHQHQHEAVIETIASWLQSRFPDRVNVFHQPLARPGPEPVLELHICKGLRKLKHPLFGVESLDGDLTHQILRFLEPVSQTIVSEESMSLNRDTLNLKAEQHRDKYFFIILTQSNCDLCSDSRPFLLTFAKMLDSRQTGVLFFFSISSNDFPDNARLIPVIRTTPALLCVLPYTDHSVVVEGWTPSEWLEAPLLRQVLPEQDIEKIKGEWERLSAARQEYLMRRVSFHACITKSLISPGDVEDRIRLEEAVHKNETMSQTISRVEAVTAEIIRDTKWLIEWNSNLQN